MKERERLEKVIEAEKMSAKQFAKEVGIQAGTLSNILAGRNNPSLDVLQRVLNRFRTLSADWLILGIGSMYRPNGVAPDNTLFDIRPKEPEDNSSANEKESASITSVVQEKAAPMPLSAQKLISRIVIFYSDGTFEER